MAGESILIVDDTPVNLKLTRILLINEGYKVITAASGEEALELLRSFHPALILADIQLPGIDGLELARRIRQNEATRDIAVVALTAFAMKGDEQRAVDAGCEGYITKPIDTRTLGARIRGHLDRRLETIAAQAAPAPATAGEPAVPAAQMLALRRQFLAEGQERARQLLIDLDGQFNADDLAKAVHTWIGTGGLLGYMAISRQAREAEALLLERPLENDRLREALTNLALAFNSPREAYEGPISEIIAQTLAGKRVALVALPKPDSLRMCIALERTSGIPVFFEIAEPPRSEALLDCDLIVVHVRPETIGSPWLDAATIPATSPVVFMGSRDHLLALDPAVQGLACEFLMDPWQPDEALVRLSLALSKDRAAAPRAGLPGAVTGKIRVAVVDDDPTVLSLVRTALNNFGMECFMASDGSSALEIVRRQRPHAIVLDINMPQMDGFEVLAAIRREGISIRVLLLTARQQEGDVLRGFALGADDYVVKPFSPMELVARLKRLLSR